MQRKATSSLQDLQGAPTQCKIEEMLKSFRQDKTYVDGECASLLFSFLGEGSVEYWSDAYTHNCIELIEALTSNEAQELVRCPGDHIKMLVRLLTLIMHITNDKPRYFSEMDASVMAESVIPEIQLQLISDRAQDIYHIQNPAL